MTIRSNLLAGVMTAMVSAIPTTAHAQTSEEVVGAEVVVTATKREEALKDIPFSISAVTEDTLIKNRVETLADVAKLTPSLEIGDGFGRQTSYVAIRGVGPQTFNSPTVITFVDGFTSGLRIDVSGEIFDLERVEVLKGPQATLYGRNAIGGTINYVTKKPSRDWEGRAEASYGSFNAYSFRAGVSGPIASGVSFRLSGSATGRDGYYDNAFNGAQNIDSREDRSARLAIRIAPDDSRFAINAAVSYSRAEDGCGDCTQSVVGYNPANPALLARRDLDVNNLTGVFNTDVPGYLKRDVFTAVLSATADLGGAELTSISGHTHVKPELVVDFNRGPGPFLLGTLPVNSAFSKVDNKVISQEIRLASTGKGPFGWLVGVYYYDLRDSNFGSLATPFGDIPTGNLLSGRENYAAFFDGSYQLTESVKLGFGLRYDVEKANQRDLATGEYLRTKDTEWLPRASLMWSVTPETNVYATASRGYHSGGLNPSAFGFKAPVGSFGPEFVWNYEVGIKGGRRGLSYDLSAYYIDWTDQQVTSTAPGTILTYVTNAGKTRIYGVEGQIQWRPTDRLSIDASAAWNHARYVDFRDDSGVPLFYGFSPQRAGERPLLAPDLSAAASVEYVQPLQGDWDVTARVGGRYTGKRSIDNSAILVAGGYATVDASLAVGNDTIRATVFASNLFNREYASFAQLFAGFQPLIRPGIPRTFGAQLSFRF